MSKTAISLYSDSMYDMGLTAYHNSRRSDCRFPQGAVCCDERITLSLYLRGDRAETARVQLRLWADGAEKLIPAEKSHANGFIRFSFSCTAPKKPQLIWYYFIIELNGRRLYYGGRSGEGRLTDNVPEDYQITCFDSCFSTPKWFREGIVYQIFPDRFRRGAPDADGRTSFDRAEFHRNLGRRLCLHENWNDEPKYLPENGEKFYVPNDYFGGDLRGIIEKLPYLASLGVSVIYLNPIFEAASNHRYNTSDYLSVDPILGTEYDYRELVNTADSFGISIILDGVFSHTGDDSIYFNRYGRFKDKGAYESKESEYYDWYCFEHFPNKYRCWWGFDTLPEVNELSPTYEKFIAGVLKKWTLAGAKGWRLDVADELPDEFIGFLRRELKRLNPDALLLGEVWEDASNKVWEKGIREYVNGFELDSVMNYPFRDAVCDFLTGRIDAFALHEVLAGQQERYPEPFYRACMNILSTHDSQRLLSVLSGAPNKNALSRIEQAKFSLTDSQIQHGKRLQRLAVILQYSMPQPPCVYYGDEAGMTGLMDPFNRKTYPWGHEDKELIAFYSALGRLRRATPALHKGDACFLPINGDLFAIYRKYGDSIAICIINRSDRVQNVTIVPSDFCEGALAPLVEFAESFDSTVGGKCVICKDGKLELNIEPISADILIGSL